MTERLLSKWFCHMAEKLYFCHGVAKPVVPPDGKNKFFRYTITPLNIFERPLQAV